MLKNEKRFDVFQGQKDGIPMTAIINKHYRQIPGRDMFPWFVWISLPLHQSGHEVDTSASESFVNKIEMELSRETDIIYVGELTWNGSREYFYYAANGAYADNALKNLVATPAGGLGFQYEIRKDSDWSSVAEMLGWQA